MTVWTLWPGPVQPPVILIPKRSFTRSLATHHPLPAVAQGSRGGDQVIVEIKPVAALSKLLWNTSRRSVPRLCLAVSLLWWSTSGAIAVSGDRFLLVAVWWRLTTHSEMVRLAMPAVLTLWRHRSIRRQVPPGDSRMKTNNTFWNAEAGNASSLDSLTSVLHKLAQLTGCSYEWW